MGVQTGAVQAVGDDLAAVNYPKKRPNALPCF
jgi:hypothetical protein